MRTAQSPDMKDSAGVRARGHKGRREREGRRQEDGADVKIAGKRART